MDSSGNISTPGTLSTGAGGSTAGGIDLHQGTALTPPANSVTIHAPTSVGTAFTWVTPGAAATGLILGTNAAGVVTLSQIGTTNHSVPVGGGTTVAEKVIPDCTDSAGNHLNFTQSTNAFSCGTSSSGGGGGGSSMVTGAWVEPFDPVSTDHPFQGDSPAGRVLLDKFTAKQSGTVNTVNINIGTSPGANKSLAIGIYDMSGNLLGYARFTGSLSPAPGLASASLSSAITLVQGTQYWSAFATEDEPATLPIGYNPWISATASNVRGYHAIATNTVSGTNTTFALPATLGTILDSNFAYKVATYHLVK
jgi:hypothetical protein